MRRRAILLLALPAVLAGVLLLAYLTFLLFPSSELLRFSSRLAAQHGVSLRIAGIGKTLPLGIRASGITVSCEGGTLLLLDRLVFRLRLLPLLAGRVVIGYEGDAARGGFSGEIEATRTGRFEIACNGIRLEGLPLLQALQPARISGTLAANGKVVGRGGGAKGTVRLSIDGLEVSGARIGGIMLPDVARQAVQAVAGVDSGVIRAENVTMQGEGLYARLRGEIRAGGSIDAAPVNLSLELMPKPDFMERQRFVFLALARYADSPGHYLLPIRGTVRRPELQ